MLQTLSFIINVAPEGVPQVVKLSQNENGRTLAFTLTGAGTVNIPSGSTVTISGTKPDGVVYSATGTLSGNVASFSETTQMTAVSGIWPAKIKVTYNGETIATCKVVMAIDPDPVAPGSVPSSSQLNGLVAEAQQYATYAKYEAFGSPLVAATAAAMTDKTRVYVYTGSETGKTAGHWYYWNGSAWTDGGVYNSQGINTDTTLTISGMAADAKATGDQFTLVKQDYSAYLFGGNTSVVPGVVLGHYIEANGNCTPITGYNATEFVNVEGCSHISINCTIYTGISFCVYDADENVLFFINGNNASDWGLTPSTQPQTISVDLPDTAKYIRASMRTNYYTKPSDFNIVLTALSILSGVMESNRKNAIAYVGASGDYTSILEALKSTSDNVKIHVLSGTYDIVQEYIDYYGSDFWANYSGYSGSTDPFLRGLWLSNGREIEFDSQAVVVFNYDGANTNVRPYFSVFATGFNATIKGLHIIHNNNCRYAIHDDFGTGAGTNVFKDCIFDGASAVGYEIGGGMGANNRYIIDNCVFLNNNSGTRDISYHNSGGSSSRNQIFISNCYGTKACVMMYHGTSTNKTYCIINNCKFASITKEATTASSTVDNMELVLWNNTTDQ